MIDKIEAVISRPIVQICWVVDDLEAAAMRWVKTLGVGPWFIRLNCSSRTVTARPGQGICFRPDRQGFST